ncbi:MAG: hypothetical protein ACHQQS_00895 [Thermoanaerobaculales bacterium]
MGETKSKTEKESYLLERTLGLPDHYKTTITDGDKKVEGRGDTAKEAEARASEKAKK